jgi:hypothetical protein
MLTVGSAAWIESSNVESCVYLCIFAKPLPAKGREGRTHPHPHPAKKRSGADMTRLHVTSREKPEKPRQGWILRDITKLSSRARYSNA